MRIIIWEKVISIPIKTTSFECFKNASEMEFDLAIQEDASLNYAKLSYELNSSKVYQLFYNLLKNIQKIQVVLKAIN
jgi:hypothetical protein